MWNTEAMVERGARGVRVYVSMGQARQMQGMVRVSSPPPCAVLSEGWFQLVGCILDDVSGDFRKRSRLGRMALAVSLPF